MSSFTAERPGFALLEAVVSLFVTALVGTAALSVAAAMLRIDDRGAHLLSARALAEERLTAIRLLTVQELVHMPDSLSAGRFRAPFTAWEWSADVEQARNEYQLFDVSIDVRWSDGSYRLGTRLFRPAARERAVS